MFKTSRLLAGILLVALLLTPLACSGAAAPATAPKDAAPAEAKYTIRLAGIYPADHHMGQAADKFAELVKQKTNGQVKVDVFHDNKLGSEREAAEGLKSGTVEMMYSGLAGIGTYVPGIHVMELPYLYKDFDHLRRVTQQLAPDLTKTLLDKGIRPVGYFYDGPRSTLAVKPMRSFADFKGLKFRVPESPLYVAMAKAMGTTPTPIALPEAYNALQTKVAEAIEGSPSTLYNGKYFEVAKYLVQTRHIYHVLYLAINDKFYQGLPQDIQKALDEAGKEAGDYQFQIVSSVNQENLEKMKAAGTEIIELSDLSAFQAAVKESNQSYAEEKGPEAVDLLARIQAIN